MLSRSRWLILCALVLLVGLGAACRGGSSATDSDDDEPPPTPVLVPSEETKAYKGETIAFSIPDNWFILDQTYEEEGPEEMVVAANMDRDVKPEDLPEGAIRFEFTGQLAEPAEAEPGEVVEELQIEGVRFTVREVKDIGWTVTGKFKIGGINYAYKAVVQMNTEEPETELIEPILQSWVVGSTNNHPQRTCISPVECP